MEGEHKEESTVAEAVEEVPAEAPPAQPQEESDAVPPAPESEAAPESQSVKGIDNPTYSYEEYFKSDILIS